MTWEQLFFLKLWALKGSTGRFRLFYYALVLISLMPLSSCMSTTITRYTTKYPPYVGFVDVFNHELNNQNYEVIGEILVKCTVACDWVDTCDRYCEKDKMIKLLKKRAAEIGGSTVILVSKSKSDNPYTYNTLKHYGNTQQIVFVKGVSTTHIIEGKAIRSLWE